MLINTILNYKIFKSSEIKVYKTDEKIILLVMLLNIELNEFNIILKCEYKLIKIKWYKMKKISLDKLPKTNFCKNIVNDVK